jgi:antitoxin CcdA
MRIDYAHTISDSTAPEAGLAEAARKERWQRWKDEHLDAIDANNRKIEEQGLWSDGLRLF